MSRWKTQRMRGGAIVQAGMNALGVQQRNRMDPERAPYRAIVASTYVTDSLDRQSQLGGSSGGERRAPAQVTCDVILTTSQIAVSRIPVAQSNFGVNNVHGLWVPRPSTRLISTGVTATAPQFRRTSDRGSPAGEPSDFSDLDGDMVLVDFVEKDIEYPIIRSALQHEQSQRQVILASGTRGSPGADDYYVSHYGTEIRIDADGSLLIDTVDAFSDPILEDATASGGEIRLRLKGSRRFTIEMDGTDVLEVFKDGSGVHIHLGEGASEAIIFGDAFKTLYDVHTHSSPAGGSTGVPAVLMDTPPGTHLSQQHKVK